MPYDCGASCEFELYGGMRVPTGDDCVCVCVAGERFNIACVCPDGFEGRYINGPNGPLLVECVPEVDPPLRSDCPPGWAPRYVGGVLVECVPEDVPATPWWEQAWDALPDWGGDPLFVDDAGGGRRSPPVPSSTTSTSSRRIAAAAAGVLGLGLVLVAPRRR